MIKQLKFPHFIIAFLCFWLVSLLGAEHSLETSQKLNFVVALIFLTLYSPITPNKKQFLIILLSSLAVLVLSFILPAKIWCGRLFFLICAAHFIIGWQKTARRSLALLIIWSAAFFNLSFITNTHIGDVQYDFASCYNYIEYILENHFKFWHENPLISRPSYSSYHPILHFFLAAVAIHGGELLSFSKAAASEAAQVLFVTYMLLFGLISARILNLFNLSSVSYFSSLTLVVFFPTYNAISGFFNNDCLLLPLQAALIYYSLLYTQNGGYKNLCFIVLFATLSTLTKLSGILILPMTLAAFLIRLIKQKDKQTFYEELIAGIFILLGISIWPIYQHFVLNLEFSFVPPQTHLSLESYTLWQRFNPLGAFVYTQMFYNDFGINLWETMTKTALFGQWDFSYRGAAVMPLVHLLIWLYKAIIATVIIAVTYLIFKTSDKKLFYLSLILLLSLLSGQILFGLKHPFMCNQDFRYIAILPLPFAMILSLFLEQIQKRAKHILISLLIAFALLSAYIWNFVSA